LENKKIKIIKSDLINISSEILLKLDEISKYSEDIVKICAFPDLHHKKKLETPSSTAIATKENIYPNFSSPSPNCGMALVNTGLQENEIKQKHLNTIMQNIMENVPLPPQKKRTITLSEFTDLIKRGANWSIERYGLNDQTSKKIENFGNMFLDSEITTEEIDSLVPEQVKNIALYEFPHIGAGNHFLEFQVVDEIFEPQIASALNIHLGQVLIMYHTGSGYFGGLLGRFYAFRKKNTKSMQLKLLMDKLKFHYLTSESFQNYVNRIRYFILPLVFNPIPAISEEGKKFLRAQDIGMNFGYANRVGILGNIKKSFRTVFGSNVSNSIELIYDVSHNSIQNENINGDSYWVHRHNSARTFGKDHFPETSIYSSIGQPILLPGMNNTNSYLGVSGEQISKVLHSVDHGAGKTIEEFYKRGLSKELTNPQFTRLYKYSTKEVKYIRHISSEGIEDIVKILNKNQIMKSVAKLRPIAVIKG